MYTYKFSRRSRLTTLLAATLVTCSLVFAPAAPAAVRHRQTRLLAGTDADSDINPMLGPAETIIATATAQFSQSFGGVILSNSASHINIYLTALTDSTEAKLSSLAPSGDTSFFQTPNSSATLQTVQQQITANYSQLQAEGINVQGYYADVETGLEVVSVENLTATENSELGQEFGSQYLDAVDVGASSTTSDTNRDDDTAPFNGGDFSQGRDTNTNLGYCTLGFPVNRGGEYGFLEASHCFGLGRKPVNEQPIPGGQMGSDAEIGQITNSDTAQGGDDVEFVQADLQEFNNTIWGGVVGSPDRLKVTGVAPNVDGEAVCNSGAFSGQDCYLTVTGKVSGCQVIDNYPNGLGGTEERMVCGVTEALPPKDTDIANQGGDSGGPVFAYVNGDVEASGVVSFSFVGENDTVMCQANTPDTCYNNLWFTGEQDADTDMGASTQQ
jgi:hypothetical protein